MNTINDELQLAISCRLLTYSDDFIPGRCSCANRNECQLAEVVRKQYKTHPEVIKAKTTNEEICKEYQEHCSRKS